MSHVTDRPQQYPEPSAQRLPREWMKIAAALIAFVAVGSLLAIIFRGNNDTPNAGAPLVTPTASVAPSATQASATSTISGVAASASATMSATMSATATLSPPTVTPAVSASATATAPSPTVTPAISASATATAPPPTATAAQTAGGNSGYLDDRSTAQSLITSLYNAINRKEYLRAYSYWEPGSPQLASYDQFQAGYAGTASVDIVLGPVASDAGAGQRYWWAPVALTATMDDGSVQSYAGCYKLRLSQPAIQGTPPFQPLAITGATIQPVDTPANAAALMASMCLENGVQPGQLEPTPSATATGIGADVYRDDRSAPEQLLRSLYNAVNSGQFVRAYSYWDPAAPGLAPYDQFAQGYAGTASVALTTGAVQEDAGAGQRYYAVPAALVATQADGSTQTFVGCYRLRLSDPAIQGTPPFQPLAIESATLQQVDNGVDTTSMLGTACG